MPTKVEHKKQEEQKERAAEQQQGLKWPTGRANTTAVTGCIKRKKKQWKRFSCSWKGLRGVRRKGGNISSWRWGPGSNEQLNDRRVSCPQGNFSVSQPPAESRAPVDCARLCCHNCSCLASASASASAPPPIELTKYPIAGQDMA